MTNSSQTVLRLVRTDTMGRQGYALSGEWEVSITSWLNWLRLRGLSPATRKLRRDHLRSIARRSKTTHPAELTREQLQLLACEYQWSKEHLKAVRTSLSSFYEWSVGEGIVTDNVALCLPKVKLPIPAPRPAPDHVWAELLAAAGPRERVMALLAGEAGLRRAEISQVHTDDLIEDMTGWSLLVHGKGGRQRIVPLTHSLAAEVRAFCNGRRGFVFVGQIDGHLSAQYVGILLSRLMPDGWSAHKLRHRYATRGYAGTGNLRAVQEALGHTSVATTQRYTAITSREVRAVSEAARNGDDVA